MIIGSMPVRSYAPQDHSGREGPIPADAGEPCSARTKSRGSRAYPRGRGGAPIPAVDAALLRGLSPRTRGSQCDGHCGYSFAGPIPADAGEPRAGSMRWRATRAYPRGRGGAANLREHLAVVLGLSPRTRGSPGLQVGVLALQGPIPADAGEPAGRFRAPCPTGAYPRGRGGAVTLFARHQCHPGLSPRTRGSRS